MSLGRLVEVPIAYSSESVLSIEAKFGTADVGICADESLRTDFSEADFSNSFVHINSIAVEAGWAGGVASIQNEIRGLRICQAKKAYLRELCCVIDG